jgi:integrase
MEGYNLRKRNRESLAYQVQERLNSKLAIGERKMKNDAKIHSWGTYKTYLKHCNYFVDYCKIEHDSKTLSECKQYMSEWLKSRQTLSAYTQKVEVSALVKLYGCSSVSLGIETPKRLMRNITRSRGKKVRDAHFSEKNHAEIVNFCRSTGLRRAELSALRGSSLIQRDEKYYINVTAATKGGRKRCVPVIGNVSNVVYLMTKAGTGRVFGKIPNGMDVHGYRSEYATAIYNAYARDKTTCLNTPFWNKEHQNGKGQPKGGYDKNSVYACRGEQKGRWLDKAAMLKASQALGHSRISVVGEHYIR